MRTSVTHAIKEFLIPPPFLRKFYGGWVYQNMDAVISVTEYNRKKALEEYGISYQKNFMIPNGVNLLRFGFLPENEENTKDDRKKVMFFGRLSPRKGVQILLKALPFEYE